MTVLRSRIFGFISFLSHQNEGPIVAVVARRLSFHSFYFAEAINRKVTLAIRANKARR